MSFKSFRWSYYSYCRRQAFRSEHSRLERKKGGCVLLVERKHNGIGYPYG